MSVGFNIKIQLVFVYFHKWSGIQTSPGHFVPR